MKEGRRIAALKIKVAIVTTVCGLILASNMEARGQEPNRMTRYCSRPGVSPPPACDKQPILTIAGFRIGPDGAAADLDVLVKADARLTSMRPELEEVFPLIMQAAAECGVGKAKVTSAGEIWEPHSSPESAHHLPGGGALDFETKNRPRAAIECWEKALMASLPPDQFHVKWESRGLPNEHMHIGLGAKARRLIWASLR